MVKVALEGAFAIACAGFCAATVTGFLALMRADFFATCFVICAIVGSVFAVITWTTSFMVPSVRLSPPNVAGASACARTPALKLTETNAVASAKKSGRLPTSARYAGNQTPWQAFFSIKSDRLVIYPRVFSSHGVTRRTRVQSSGG